MLAAQWSRFKSYPEFSLTSSIFPDFSLTTLEFPDFSRWVVTLRRWREWLSVKHFQIKYNIPHELSTLTQHTSRKHTNQTLCPWNSQTSQHLHSSHHPTDDRPLLVVVLRPALIPTNLTLLFAWSIFGAVPLTKLASLTLWNDVRRTVMFLPASDSDDLWLDVVSAAPTFSTWSGYDDRFFRIDDDVVEWPLTREFCICDCGHDFTCCDFFFLRCRFWKS